MPIKIGHASKDENNTYTNGKAGDQTKKEVCTREWYSKPWEFVLRPTSSTIAEKMAKACEAGCANNKIGYDQNQRNTLNTQAAKVGYDLSKITTACETDCSAFMAVCAIAAGVNLSYGSNGPTTSTIKSAFKNTGKFTVLTDSKYLTSDNYLKRGDVLVKPGSHTVMALQNGSKAGQDNGGGSGNGGNTKKYYPKYTGSSSSLTDALKAVGETDTSLAHRKKIAAANGIAGYTGTAAQNTKMLSLLKSGQLVKA